MSEPVLQSWSLDQLRDNARDYMLTMYGKPKETNDPDQWYMRAGLLNDFVSMMWHEMPHSAPPEADKAIVGGESR